MSLCAGTRELWRWLGPLLWCDERSFVCNCSPIVIPGVPAHRVRTDEHAKAELVSE